MSHAPLAADHNRNQKECGNCQHGTEQAYDAFFRFRPIPFVQHLIRQADEYESAKEKRDYYTDAMRSAWYRLLSSHTLKRIGFAIILAGGALFLYLWYRGAFESETVVALFTVIMAITTYLQWQAIREENAEFVKQNQIMIEQNKALFEQNELWREQLAQTRAQMKLENRAWLGIMDVQIKTLAKGYNKVLCTITVKNSGKTPGTIIAGLINYYVRPIDYSEECIIYEFEREPLQDQVHRVNPGEGIIIEGPPLGEVDDATIEEIRMGRRKLHILANFRYRDVAGEPHEEKGFHTFVGLGPDKHRRANYCGVY